MFKIQCASHSAANAPVSSTSFGDCTPDSSPELGFFDSSKGAVVLTGSFGKPYNRKGPKCVNEH